MKIKHYLLPNEEKLGEIAGNFLFEAGQKSILIEYAGLTFSEYNLRTRLYDRFTFISEGDFDKFFQALIQASRPL